MVALLKEARNSKGNINNDSDGSVDDREIAVATVENGKSPELASTSLISTPKSSKKSLSLTKSATKSDTPKRKYLSFLVCLLKCYSNFIQLIFNSII